MRQWESYFEHKTRKKTRSERSLLGEVDLRVGESFRRFVQQNNVGGVVVGVKYACLVNSSDFDVFSKKRYELFQTIRLCCIMLQANFQPRTMGTF